MRLVASLAVAAALFTGGAATAMAEDLAPNGGEWRHGISAFGDLKYGPHFEHFDYVNPDAPVGGELRTVGAEARFNVGFLTFDTLNIYVLQGDGAQGMQYTFDSLMTRAWDEPDAMYGLVADAAAIAPDRMSVAFRLRPEARFRDGTPVTAEDVVFTFDTLKAEGHPIVTQQIRDVVSAEALDERTVLYTFEGELVRDLPLRVAELPIFSKAYYTGHTFNAGTLEPPLGSGPYEVADVQQGRSIAFERDADYWGWGLPVNVGRFNFQRLRYDYYRERTAQFEGFKSGAYDLHEEFTSRFWATQYNFPAVLDGRVVRLTMPDDRPSGAQGWFINTRRDRFKDRRVRKALDYAFDFEWTNRVNFHDLYLRTQSYFENSVMKAEGPPSAEEIELLDPWRDELPPEVFGEPYVPPVSDGSGKDRKLLREARNLLREAGWNVVDGKLTNAAGEVFTIEFMSDAPTFERVIQPYIKNLEQLGIEANIRLVDAAQYQSRMKEYDFDIAARRFAVGETPGIELRNLMSSEAAAQPGTYNLSGISNPAVDALIEKIISARDRETLVIAARALDRVLRAGHYWVPQWYKATHTLAYWDKYDRPAVKPKFHRGVVETWWVDAEKAAALRQ